MPQFHSRRSRRHSILMIALVGAPSILTLDTMHRSITTTVLAFTHVHRSFPTEIPLKRDPLNRRVERTMLPLRTLRGRYMFSGIQPYHQRYSNDDADSEREREFIPLLESRQKPERPTQTSAELLRTPTLPAKPKIVVFGASGLLGRHVVRQLLEHPQLNDATIVAFVRDYDKACRVLYDDMIVASSRRQKGAKLLIVQGDLVPPEELPNHRTSRNENSVEFDDDDDEHTKESPANDRSLDKSTSFDDNDDILREVISDCTTIISCVGTVRITNFWTDYIARPFYRILRPNVSDWCYDRHHPYYVHFRTMQKIIYFAEQEQLRRQATEMDDFDPSTVTLDIHNPTKQKKAKPKIRLVRISDLCVAQPPWYLIPILINAFHSMIFRYHYMADQLLEQCTHLDTITVRPGDIVDDERDSTTTSIQINPTGRVPYPARISREDTAEVVVAAALWNNRNHAGRKEKYTTKSSNADNIEDDDDVNDKSFHYTLACRWVGNEMDPYPAQGHVTDGHPTAYQCLQSTLGGHTIHDATTKIHRPKKELKPYGICAAIPVYMFISLLLSSIVFNLVGSVPKLPQLMKLPLLFPLKHALSTILTFVGGFLHYLQWMINLRSYKNIKYISF